MYKQTVPKKYKQNLKVWPLFFGRLISINPKLFSVYIKCVCLPYIFIICNCVTVQYSMILNYILMLCEEEDKSLYTVIK
jgi:hypothetical protein